MVDTLGLLMLVSVTTAGIQDRTAAYRVLEQVRFVMASVVMDDQGPYGAPPGAADTSLPTAPAAT